MCPGYGDYSERHSDIREILTDKCRRVDWPPESPDNQYHLNK